MLSQAKRPRVKSTVEEIPFDLIAVVAEDGVDEVDVEIGDAEPTVPPRFSLHAMMETFMTTQVAHGQLLDELITEVIALRANFSKYRSAFPPPPPFDLC